MMRLFHFIFCAILVVPFSGAFAQACGFTPYGDYVCGGGGAGGAQGPGQAGQAQPVNPNPTYALPPRPAPVLPNTDAYGHTAPWRQNSALGVLEIPENPLTSQDAGPGRSLDGNYEYALPQLQNPLIINVPANAGGDNITINIPSGRDACLIMPDQVISKGLKIVGGRNVRVIGGHIVSAQQTGLGCECNSNARQRGVCLERFACPTNQQKSSISFVRQSGSFALWGTHVDANGLFADNVEITKGHPNHDAYLRNVYFEGGSGTPPGTHGDLVHAQVRGEGFGTLYAEDSSFRSGYTGFMMHEGNVAMRDVDIAQDRELLGNPQRCWPMNNLPNTQEIWRSFGDNQCRFGFAILAENGTVNLNNVYIEQGHNVQGRASYPGLTRGTPPGGAFAAPSQVGLNFQGGEELCAGD